MRYVSPDGTGTDLGIIDLSRDMFAVLSNLFAAGASPDVEMVRTLRQQFHVRFDVYTHCARLDAARLERTSDFAAKLRTQDEASICTACKVLAAFAEDKETVHNGVKWLIDELIAFERASRKRVRVRAGPTGRPNIGSKRAREAARAKRAA